MYRSVCTSVYVCGCIDLCSSVYVWMYRSVCTSVYVCGCIDLCVQVWMCVDV